MAHSGSFPLTITPICPSLHYPKSHLLPLRLRSHSTTTNPTSPIRTSRPNNQKPSSTNPPCESLQAAQRFLTLIPFTQSPPPIDEINKALTTLTKAGKHSTTLFYFNQLQSLDTVQLDLHTFNIAINCYGRVQRLGFGFSLLGGIFKRGCTPNVVTFATLLSQLGAQGDGAAAEVVSLFNKLRLLDIRLYFYTFRIAIIGYCCLNRVGFGFSLLGCIFKCGCRPDEDIFAALLNGLIIDDKIVEALELFGKIVRRGEYKSDEWRYGSLINRLCKIGNTGAAISFLRIAEEGGLKPDTVEYTMIIDRLAKDGLGDAALNFLVEMKSKGICADAVTYNSLIDGLCKHDKWQEAMAMLREMLGSAISPDVFTFHTMIWALCKRGMPKEAEELLEVMEERGVDPDVVIYTSLMVHYRLLGRMDEVLRLFDAMVVRGLHPDTYCYSILNQGILQEDETR